MQTRVYVCFSNIGESLTVRDVRVARFFKNEQIRNCGRLDSNAAGSDYSLLVHAATRDQFIR